MHRYHITSLTSNFSLSKTCLTYLLYFESPNILTANAEYEFPFIRYAAAFWWWHYKYIADDAKREVLDFLGYRLMESKSCFINWLRIFNPELRSNNPDLNLDTKRIPSPLYCMSDLDVSGVVQLLLDNGADFNAEGGIFHYALSAASYGGHKKVVQLLLTKGANVNAGGGNFGNALLGASLNGHEDVVRLLLENGANVNAEGRLYKSPASSSFSP